MQLVKIEQAKQGIHSASANAEHQAAEFKRLSRLVQKQSVSKTNLKRKERVLLKRTATLKLPS